MYRLFFVPVLLSAFVGHGLGHNVSPAQQSLSSDIAVAGGWSYTNCGLPTDPIQLISITISPDPPVAGEKLTVTVKVQIMSPYGAYVDVTVKLGLIKLLQKQFDMCEEGARANMRCPVEKGVYEVSHNVTLPVLIPAALYAVSVRGYTVDDDPMTCLNLKADFRNTSSVIV